MCFIRFQGTYETWYRELAHHRDYYPLRVLYSTAEVASKCDCHEEVVRKILKELETEFAFRVTERHEHSGRDVTQWKITNVGLSKVAERWQRDRELLREELKLAAADNDIDAICQSVRTPLVESKAAIRARTLLTRQRKRTS
jgi:predicted ArsR family transcriptional regulator